jgi:hypothetical protein
MYPFLIHAPRLGDQPTDPIDVLAHCETLDDVHRSFRNVRSILEPVLGRPADDGATREVVRSFVKLLQHPLGPCIAAEALSLLAAIRGLLPSRSVAQFLTSAGGRTQAFAPVPPPIGRLVAEVLADSPTPASRLELLDDWWKRCDRIIDLACDERPATLSSWDMLAHAPADRLAAHAKWLAPADQARLVTHRALFHAREDAELLQPLVRAHPDAALANPACTARTAAVLRSLPPAEPPARTPADSPAPRRGRYVVNCLVPLGEWAEWTHAGYLPDVRIGWFTPPSIEIDPLDQSRIVALVAAVDRPPTPIAHVAGMSAFAWRDPDPTICAEAQRIALALDGTNFTNRDAMSEIWHVEVLQTTEAISRNAHYMRNCTASLYGAPGDIGRVLCRLTHRGVVLNASLHHVWDTGWQVTEVNSRFNAGVRSTGLVESFASHAAATVARALSNNGLRPCLECGSLFTDPGKVCADCRTGAYEHFERWDRAA